MFDRITEKGFRLSEHSINRIGLDVDQKRMAVIVGVVRPGIAGALDLENEEKLNTREAGEILGVPPEVVRKLIKKEWLPTAAKYNFIAQLHDGYLLRKEDVIKIKPAMQHIILTMLKQIEMNRKMGRVKAAKTRQEKNLIHSRVLAAFDEYGDMAPLFKAVFYLKNIEGISGKQFEKKYDELKKLTKDALKWIYVNFGASETLKVSKLMIHGLEGEQIFSKCLFEIKSADGEIKFNITADAQDMNEIPEPGNVMRIDMNNFIDVYVLEKTEKPYNRYVTTSRIAIRELKKIIFPK